MTPRPLRWPVALLAGALMLGCGAGDTTPEAKTKREATKKIKKAKKELDRARRVAKARKQNVNGGVELAAFAQDLSRSLAAGDQLAVEQLFVDPALLEACSIQRPKNKAAVSGDELRSFLVRRRAALDRFAAPLTDSSVVALVHKVRTRKRMMGGKISGERCPVEARGRVSIVLAPATPPPDVIENRFEAMFIEGRWWAFSYERAERDCSELGAPEAFGCRALRSTDGVDEDDTGDSE